MSRVVSATKVGGSRHKPALEQLTLEEEIFSLHEVAPEALRQLPALFAESVVHSATKILGEATGEALVRRIGDSKLRDPIEVYSCLESFLMGGSDEVKDAIIAAFKGRVHRIYKLTMEVAAEGHP